MTIVLAGCGRVGFDRDGEHDASTVTGDGTIADAPPPQPLCTNWSAFGAPVSLSAMNTNALEWAPIGSSDGLTLVFSRGNTASSMNVWMATRMSTTAAFGNPVELTALSTAGSDDDGYLSSDRLEIFFDRGQPGTSTIYVSKRMTPSDVFGTPTAVTMTGFSGDNWAPALADGDRTLYFNTRQTGPVQIAWATRPTRADPFVYQGILNQLSPGNEVGFPAPSADGHELFFQMFGSPIQVWVARRANTSDPFGAGSHVTETSSSNGDGDPGLSADGTALYFASTRGGNMDLWSATRTCP